jgi:hypothetical protein
VYFKLLETFVLKILFSKDEYNITSKNFNPIRFFVISVLVLNVFFTVYLLTRLNHVYVKVQTFCPAAIEEIIKKKLPKEVPVLPKK